LKENWGEGQDHNTSATYLDSRAHNCFDIAGQLGGLDGNDSDIETEAKWFDEPSNDGPKNTSRMSDAMAAEVCPLSV